MNDTPDAVFKWIVDGLQTSAPVDMSGTTTLTTEIGKQVVHWLADQAWIKHHSMDAKILERKEEGTRYEIVQLYELPDGVEKVALIFFGEDGQWKFHDIFLFHLKGIKFEMFLSRIVRDPAATLEVFLKNPHLALEQLEKLLPWLWALFLRLRTGLRSPIRIACSADVGLCEPRSVV